MSDTNDTTSNAATMTPPDAADVADNALPPLPPTLAELFARDDIVAAARLLHTIDSGQVRAELPQAFAVVPTAPSCFLRCMQLWTTTTTTTATANSADALGSMLGIIETAVTCMQSARSLATQQPVPLSDADTHLAGEMVQLLPMRRVQLVATFATAFCVPPAALATVAIAALQARASIGVQLLLALRHRDTSTAQLVPPETVLLAAIDQQDVRAGDVFVARDRVLQVQFVHLLLATNASDAVVSKRIRLFGLDVAAFPAFAAKRQRAALRYLVYSAQYAAALDLAGSDQELREYASSVLLRKRGADDPAVRAFIRAAGCADAFPCIRTSDDCEDDDDNAILLPQDEYASLATCLSVVDAVGTANVVFVDDVETLSACAAHLAGQQVVGFDCEWKATHVATATHANAPCATLQIASIDRAFVVDVLALGDAVGPALATLFSDDHVLKLAFAAQGDLKLLRAVLGTPHGVIVVSSLLDLQTVARTLHRHGVGDAEAMQQQITDVTTKSAHIANDDMHTKSAHETTETAAVADDVTLAVATPATAQLHKTRRGGKAKRRGWSRSSSENDTSAATGSAVTLSLSGVAKQYLGKPLDKRARLSDWERRPLTRAQLEYAALDAHVLVQILAAMRQQHAPAVLEPIVRRCTQKNVR